MGAPATPAAPLHHYRRHQGARRNRRSMSMSAITVATNETSLLLTLSYRGAHPLGCGLSESRLHQSQTTSHATVSPTATTGRSHFEQQMARLRHAYGWRQCPRALSIRKFTASGGGEAEVDSLCSGLFTMSRGPNHPARTTSPLACGPPHIGLQRRSLVWPSSTLWRWPLPDKF